MEPSPQLTDIAEAIRLAVTPIFLLAGVGITVNILIVRLGRIVDRARVLEGQQQQAAGARPVVETELRVLSRRARLIYQAIALSIACALSELSQKFLDYEASFGILSSGRRSGVCPRSIKKYD